MKFVAEMKIGIAHVLLNQFGQMNIVEYVKKTLRSAHVRRTIRAPMSITRHSMRLSGKQTMVTATRTKINERRSRVTMPDGTIHD